MKDKYKDPRLTYALDSLGKMVYVGSVERGLSCNCRCPKCNEVLVAKLGHEGGRQPHFAHRKDSECHGSYMSALHKFAEQIIEEEKAVMTPAYKEIDKQKLEFEKVEIEQRVERKDLQPDIVGVTSNGLRWFIEIRNTHEVDEAKRAKLIESNITCLEIDVREQKLGNLRTFLLESVESREWINNPIYDKKIDDLYRTKVSIIIRHLKEIPEIQISQGDNISLHNLSISVSEDGLYAGIKAVSSNGIPYLFHIGNHKALEQIKATTECNELLINTDKIHFKDGKISVLNMERLYLYIPEKEREAKIQEYKITPQYEVRPKADCYSMCRYRPFYGKCIYSKEIITQQGEDYVVCDKEKRLKDEAYVPSQNKIADTRFSYNTSSRIMVDDPQKITIRERNNKEIAQIKQKREERVVHPQSKPLADTLPFDRFWTTEEFYTQLQSTSSYETENGLFAEILKCERINRRILLLYRDPNGVRTYWPYHITIICVKNGGVIRNKVGDFTNRKAALNSYYMRLLSMRESSFLMRPEENTENELPF